MLSMKTYLLIYLLIMIVSCNESKSISTNRNYDERTVQADSLYNVYKIDSINLFYLIYVKRRDTLYKIVSKKDEIDHENDKIKVGNYYAFKLHSFLKERLKSNPELVPINYLDVNCFAFDKETNICLEKGIPDLSFADNLKGLYYQKP